MRPPFLGSKALGFVFALCLGFCFVFVSLFATGCAVTYGDNVQAKFLSATPESTQVHALPAEPVQQNGILSATKPEGYRSALPEPNKDSLTTPPTPAALPESLDIFFAGNPPPFPYQSLGLIEVQGAKYSSHEEVFARLKYEAIQRRADAITEVQRLSTMRETGTLFSDKSDDYGAITMTAIAARYTDGRKPTTPLNSGVRAQVKSTIAAEEHQVGFELFFSLVVAPIIIVVALIMNSKQ